LSVGNHPLDLAVSKIRFRVTKREFDGLFSLLAPVDGIVGRYFVEKTALAAIGTRLSKLSIL
jgi:hypothetical protein